MEQHRAGQPGIAELAMQTVDDAKRWARAETAYYKALAGERGGDAGIGVGLALAAAGLVQAAVVALLVGLVLTLAPAVGPGWATLIVVVATLLIASIIGMVAIGRLRRAARPLGEES
ncbi:phage holin family protein [Sphingomonas sp. IW22]|uniref:phage holin family protein n=1 Tax=Sphingomonas sp. IW22 TaxID=3242489 RepID=UPI0035230947